MGLLLELTKMNTKCGKTLNWDSTVFSFENAEDVGRY
jgi:hypothetical protein